MRIAHLKILAVTAVKPFPTHLQQQQHCKPLELLAEACIHLLHYTPTKPHSTVVLFAINKFIISFLLSAHSFLSLLHTSHSIRIRLLHVCRSRFAGSHKNVKHTYEGVRERALSRTHIELMHTE